MFTPQLAWLAEHATQVFIVQRLLTPLVLQAGVFHVATLVCGHVFEHAVFGVALYAVCASFVVRPPGHAVQVLLALDALLYEPIGHSTWAVYPDCA